MILSVKEAILISHRLKKENKKIVICGGCFDILHIGHTRFLKKSKEEGDSLFILLESDINVKKIKGEGKPINSQKDRAEILSSLKFVDYVILLKEMKKDKDYDDLIYSIKPDVITVTKDNGQEANIKRQAKMINALVIPVIARVKNKSTTELSKLISKYF